MCNATRSHSLIEENSLEIRLNTQNSTEICFHLKWTHAKHLNYFVIISDVF